MSEYTQGLSLPFGIQPTVPVLVDSWSGPYSSVGNANLNIPQSVRKQTRFVHIIDSADNNKGKLYWYKDGVTDSDLVPFAGTIDLSTKADLVNGKIPAYQLPSSVDDITEVLGFFATAPVSATEQDLYYNTSDKKVYTYLSGVWSNPTTPESNKLYLTLNDDKIFRWSGTTFGEISASIVLGETSSTAYRGDRGKIAYDHSQINTGGNPHGTRLSEIVGADKVENTTDLEKPVSTATQQALNELEALIGATFISKTYAQLVTLKTNSGLEPAKWYLISDFQTKHIIPNTNVINTGNSEPLLIRAIDVDEFDFEVKSALFPKDIIHYNFDDNSCEDGTWDSILEKYTGGTSRNGKIIYRKDIIHNLSCYYDWRNVKFRRWKISASNYVASSNYSKNKVIKSVLYPTKLYICLKNITNASTDPGADTTNWKLIFDLSVNEYLAFDSDNSVFNIGTIDTSSITIGTYQDFYTFTLTDDLTNSGGILSSSGNGYTNIEFNKINHNMINQKYSIVVDYNNSVCLMQSSNNNSINIFGKDCFNNTINLDSGINNKFGNNFSFNIITKGIIENNDFGDFFQNNLIHGLNFQNNIFSKYSSNNIFDDFYQNNIANQIFGNNIFNINISQNIFGSRFQQNYIAGNCNFNNFGTEFQENFIGIDCENNVVGVSFKQNTIGNSFVNNRVCNGFQQNTIGTYFSLNTIENSFSTNTIGNYFINNKIFNNFQQNTVPNNFQQNTVDSDLTLTNFSTATIISQNYSKNLFKNASGIFKLSYYNTSNNIVIVDVTA